MIRELGDRLVHRPSPPVPRRFEIQVDNLDVSMARQPAISPDGRKVAYVADGQAWVRWLDRSGAQMVTSADMPVSHLFWSPDSRFLGFHTDVLLQKVNLENRAVTTIAHVGNAAYFRGAAWGNSGSVVFADGSHIGLKVVSAEGGKPAGIGGLEPARERGELMLSAPHWLPDSRGLLFLTVMRDGTTLKLWDGKKARDLFHEPGERLVNPAYCDPGYVVFERTTTIRGIWALPFSLQDMEVTGRPLQIITGAKQQAFAPSVSRRGDLTCLLKTSASALVEINRAGTIVRVLGIVPGTPVAPALSPSQEELAYWTPAQGADEPETKVLHLSSTNALVTVRGPGKTVFSRPVWDREGEALFLSAYDRRNPLDRMIVRQTVHGVEKPTVVGKGLLPNDVSPDGQHLLFGGFAEGSAYSPMRLFAQPLTGAAVPIDLKMPETAEVVSAVFSPNGNFIAGCLVDPAKGVKRLFVSRFPEANETWALAYPGSVDQARWNTDDRILFVDAAENVLMEIPFDPNRKPPFGVLRLVLSGNAAQVELARGFDVFEGGASFLAVQDHRAPGEERGIVFCENWHAALAEGKGQHP